MITLTFISEAILDTESFLLNILSLSVNEAR